MAVRVLRGTTAAEVVLGWAAAVVEAAGAAVVAPAGETPGILRDLLALFPYRPRSGVNSRGGDVGEAVGGSRKGRRDRTREGESLAASIGEEGKHLCARSSAPFLPQRTHTHLKDVPSRDLQLERIFVRVGRLDPTEGEERAVLERLAEGRRAGPEGGGDVGGGEEEDAEGTGGARIKEEHASRLALVEGTGDGTAESSELSEGGGGEEGEEGEREEHSRVGLGRGEGEEGVKQGSATRRRTRFRFAHARRRSRGAFGAKRLLLVQAGGGVSAREGAGIKQVWYSTSEKRSKRAGGERLSRRADEAQGC